MRWLAASARSLLILLCAGVLVFGTANAANTIVTAIVCSPDGAVITLAQPVSDSTVNNPNVTVAGSVSQSDTMEVVVDGIHRTTINLSGINQTFSATVVLSEGTHEIRLVAQDICSVKNGTATAVVTYFKQVIPTVGATVPTVTARPDTVSATGSAVIGGAQPVGPLSDGKELTYGDSIIRGVLDESQPIKAMGAVPGIIAIPFVVGAGAFGWIHLRRLGQR